MNMCILVCSGCYSKIPQSGYLKQWKLIFSQFSRLVVSDKVQQGQFQKELSSSLADSHFLVVSLHGLSSVYTQRGERKREKKKEKKRGGLQEGEKGN